MKSCTPLLLAIVLAGTADLDAHAGDVRFVRAAAPPGGDGLSWATAYHDLQDALADAAGDPTIEEIWIAAGTYVPDRGLGQRDMTFRLVGGVEVLGGFAGDEISRDQRDPEVHRTMLSGDLNGDDLAGFVNISENARRVISAIGLAAPAVLDGLSVTGGNADFPGGDLTGGGGLFVDDGQVLVDNCRFEANSAGQNMPDLGGFGGAIFLDVGEVTVRNSRFAGNRATNGGAIGVFEGRLDVVDSEFAGNAAPHQVGGVMWAATNTEIGYARCTFTGNSAQYAGALFTVLSIDVDVIDCDFTGNRAAVWAGACWFQRSDANDTVTTIIERCTFIDNAAGSRSCLLLEENDTLLKDCTFLGNRSLRDDSTGGAVITLFDDLDVINCLFSGNRSGFGGAITLFRNEVASITNCSMAGNVAVFPNAGGAIRIERTAVAVSNTILWDNVAGGTQNEAAQISLSNAAASVNFCDIEGLTGGLGGTGNIDADPRFADALGPDGVAGTPDDDLHLLAGAPVIDAADNLAVPGGVVEDLDGNPRFIDDPDTPDTGRGTPPLVDMGAFEFQADGAAVPPDSFDVIFGAYRSGEVADLRESDDEWVRVEQRPAFTPQLPLIRIDVEGRAFGPVASAITTTLEAGTTAQPSQPLQRLSLFDDDAGAFEPIDQRTATLADSVVEVTITADASRFIEPGTNAVRMRIEYFDPGNVFFPAWGVRLDQARWRVTP